MTKYFFEHTSSYVDRKKAFDKKIYLKYQKKLYLQNISTLAIVRMPN